jgi:hypothetical protein
MVLLRQKRQNTPGHLIQTVKPTEIHDLDRTGLKPNQVTS